MLFGIFLLVLLYTQADARGEIPPPPPFMGGNIGEWRGLGPKRLEEPAYAAMQRGDASPSTWQCPF